MIADLAAAFPENTQRLAAALSLSAGQSGSVKCSDLLEADVLIAAVDRLAKRFPHAGRSDLAVVWARRYCIRLLGGVIFPTFLIDRQLPLALEEISLVIDDGNGFPAGFVLAHSGTPFDTIDPFERISPLVRDHIEPLLMAVARHGKAPIKVLWGNAAVAFNNLIQHARLTAEEAGRAPKGDLSVLITATHWPDGWKNPLHEPYLPQADANARPVRKTCCLHYRLEPQGHLCTACPILEKQNRRATCVTDAA